MTDCGVGQLVSLEADQWVDEEQMGSSGSRRIATGADGWKEAIVVKRRPN